MSNSRYTHIDDVTIMAETEKALLLDIGGEELWVPLSQVADKEQYLDRVGECDVNISITTWFCEKAGIEGDEE